MTIAVYSISGAPRCWRVLVGLTLKDLDFEVLYLEASKGEHKADDFLSINPRGKVPVIEAAGVLIRDSTAILAWLDREYPDVPLFGSSPAEAATIWQECMEAREYLRSAAQGLLFPFLVRQLSLAEIGDEQQAAIQAAGEAMQRELGRLETTLAGQEFLCGAAPSAADAYVYPELRLLGRALERKPEEMNAFGFRETREHYPLLFEWVKRVSLLPGMEKTEPRHWN